MIELKSKTNLIKVRDLDQDENKDELLWVDLIE